MNSKGIHIQAQSKQCKDQELQAHPTSRSLKHKYSRHQEHSCTSNITCIQVKCNEDQSQAKNNALKIIVSHRTSCKGDTLCALRLHIHEKCFETLFETRTHNDHIISFKIKFI